ncbi:hypothetical protein DWB61_02105 [Ancylomarina euxinus]|uniref:Cytochrome C Planctomycete-type domain-containing protein n=1 Tax=Ancylomarina euxinus TaxID=2283627 RepID=A0A425Y916_9BACT|nr:hypothetical protein [Ancylomarina euxinus]MCZ4693299.1 hypothetical protein [Ancylomarina euxinus]MUP13526.1 hypothetical protein [Ancylomarina euxinus]RRG24824.1 hypothetical protein DWB61_02105 [Ancylomarina euxinus]
MKRYIKVLAFLFMIGLVACEYDYIVETVPTPEPDPENPISFTAQVEPIFQSKCIGCHDSRTPILVTGSAFANLTNGGFINTANPAESKVYKRSTDGHGQNMGSQERLLLLTWITEGAKDN